MQYNEGSKAFTIGSGGSYANRLAKLASGKAVLNTATATDDPIGVFQDKVDENDVASVKFLNCPGTQEIEAAGAIDAEADVFAAASGKIQALPATPGTYRKIGKALEAASGDGSIIEVLAYDFNATETVSG